MKSVQTQEDSPQVRFDANSCDWQYERNDESVRMTNWCRELSAHDRRGESTWSECLCEIYDSDGDQHPVTEQRHIRIGGTEL